MLGWIGLFLAGIVIAKFYSDVSGKRIERESKLKAIQRKLDLIEKREQENSSVDDQAVVKETKE